MSNKTHYENLKVSNDAPSDVIRAAYKALTQKYNADRNPSAEIRMQLEIINASNSVLTNPIKRAEYDKWLLEQNSTESEERKSINKQKAIKNKKVIDVDKEIIIGKESDVIAYKNKNNGKRRAVYISIGLSVLIASAWFGIASDLFESSDNSAENTKRPEIAENIPNSPTLSDASADNGVVADSEFKPDITSIDIPAHDKVSMGKFIGIWQSSASGSQRLLDISKKTESTIVFKLNAKTGQSIGGVYGIAEFQNNYALYVNKEYDCSILFTIKSNMLQVSTSSCQEYHSNGVEFDGLYSKPGAVVAVKKPATTNRNTSEAKSITDNAIIQPQQPTVLPEAIKNAPKLYKFTAKVKDVEGNVSDIELMAKDKNAARAIIRDFRGNPEVLKLKQLKNN